MKIDKKVFLMMLLVSICSGVISSYYFSKESDNKKVEVRKQLDIKDNSMLSVYLETEEGSGEYKLSEEDVFLHDGYYFNEEKSKCENGGTLTFDKTTGNIRMSTVASDRCFVYFDKVVPSLGNFANYIKSLYTTQGANGLYYHNSTLENGANDNSYRYAGANDVVNNFVCFGSNATNCPSENLYRIIGVFDNKIKLIKYDYATKEQLGTSGDFSNQVPITPSYKGTSQVILAGYHWNYNGLENHSGNNQYGSGNWQTSLLNKTDLNTNFLNNMGSVWTNKIAVTRWNIGGGSWTNVGCTNAKTTYDYEVGSKKVNKTYDAKIGLMYVNEYAYAAYPNAWKMTPNSYNSEAVIANNWMYMGIDEWTITTYSDTGFLVFYVNGNGHVHGNNANYGYPVRPSFSLISDVELLRGTGTKTDPYRIKL